MPRRHIFRVAAAVGAATVALGLLAPAGASAGATPGPCGTIPSDPLVPPTYSHIVVIMEENLSYAAFNNTAQAPYLHALSAACGSEALMHAATHPSQPNYMAATSGFASPLGTRSAKDNIFFQTQTFGDSWKSYEESMKTRCASLGRFFKAGHNPAYWYDDLRTPTNTCAVDDVPLSPALGEDIAADSLPTFSWITPNVCNDMHWLSGCPERSGQRIATGDRWISAMLPRLTAMPSYLTGQTLIVITWDEGNGAATKASDCTDSAVYATQPSCHIATIVVSPYITPGTVDSSNQNLYSLLGTIEDILGYPRLGRAVDQPSMRPGLGF